MVLRVQTPSLAHGDHLYLVTAGQSCCQGQSPQNRTAFSPGRLCGQSPAPWRWWGLPYLCMFLSGGCSQQVIAPASSCCLSTQTSGSTSTPGRCRQQLLQQTSSGTSSWTGRWAELHVHGTLPEAAHDAKHQRYPSVLAACCRAEPLVCASTTTFMPPEPWTLDLSCWWTSAGQPACSDGSCGRWQTTLCRTRLLSSGAGQSNLSHMSSRCRPASLHTATLTAAYCCLRS